jgi:hypothetical protein
MVSVLYIMASAMMWFFLIRKRFNGMKRNGEEVNTRRIMLDRAIAWSAFAVVFACIGTWLLHWLEWEDVNGAVLIGNIVIVIAGLFSVRELTRASMGSVAIVVFATLTGLAGFSLMLWG